jgi:hypothetical protein
VEHTAADIRMRRRHSPPAIIRGAFLGYFNLLTPARLSTDARSHDAADEASSRLSARHFRRISGVTRRPARLIAAVWGVEPRPPRAVNDTPSPHEPSPREIPT